MTPDSEVPPRRTANTLARGRPLIQCWEINSPLRGEWAAAAIVFAVALYLTRWGPGTVRSVAFLLDPTTPPPPSFSSSLEGILGSIALGTCGIIALRLLARQTGTDKERLGLGRWRWRAILGDTVVFFATGTLVLGSLLIGEGFLKDLHPWLLDTGVDTSAVAKSGHLMARTLSVIESGLGGAVEEIVVLALLTVSLRAARVSWPTVYTIAVIFRLTFHIHYGFGIALAMTLWAAGVVALYHLTGRLWAIFAAHFVHNALVAGPEEFGTHFPAHAKDLEALSGLCLSLIFLFGIFVLVILAFQAFRAKSPS